MFRAAPLIVVSALDLTVIITATLFVVFKPNGDVAAFIQHPATAAWIQAVGSVAAILAAIVIDQGSARRQLSQEERSRRIQKREWENCLREIETLTRNAARLLQREAPGLVQNDQPRRLLDNAAGMIDVYLAHFPPSTDLAFALASARSHLNAPIRAAALYHDGEPGQAPPNLLRRRELSDEYCRLTDRAAGRIAVLRSEYQTGIWHLGRDDD